MTIGRAGLLVSGALLLIAGIYAAARGGLADAHYFNASVILATVDAKRLPRPADLASAQASLSQALALEPANPLFVEQRARIYEIRARQLPHSSPAAYALRRQSLRQFRNAAVLRPGSPYVWAAIAALKSRLNDLDREFYGALERAARYGEWEPGIQLALVDIGFGTWQQLTPPARRLVLEAANHALVLQGPDVRRIAARHGVISLVCADRVVSQAMVPGLCVNK